MLGSCLGNVYCIFQVGCPRTWKHGVSSMNTRGKLYFQRTWTTNLKNTVDGVLQWPACTNQQLMLCGIDQKNSYHGISKLRAFLSYRHQRVPVHCYRDCCFSVGVEWLMSVGGSLLLPRWWNHGYVFFHSYLIWALNLIDIVGFFKSYNEYILYTKKLALCSHLWRKQ